MAHRPPPGNLADFQFTFESYLDSASRTDKDDSSLSADIDSQSLSESISTYEEENGRTYHSYRAGSYHYPNDEAEKERLEIQYEAVKLILDGRNYLAPLSRLSPPRHILDVATGTGTWAIEMGDEFPGAQIIGTDLSPMQPAHVPPNVRFFVEDSSDDWDYPHGFDYVHTRLTLGCWADMRSDVEIFVRLGCDDGTVPADSATARLVAELESASATAGRQLVLGDRLAAWLRETGFADVQEAVFMVPVNGWPADDAAQRRIGALWQRNLLDGLSAFSLGLLHRVRGRSVEEIEVSLVDVRRELLDQSVHAYQKLYVVWGRKPEAPQRTTKL